MANGIKIGNLDISSFKVGSSDCKVYLGDTKLYPIWTFIESNTQNVPNAVAIRIPSNTVLQGNHNIAFGDTQVNVYSLLYENGVWYNWRVITDGQYTPSSKTPLTSVDGYYVIEFDDSYPFLGSDGDSSGQGGVNYTTFDIEIKEGGTQPTPPTPTSYTWVFADEYFVNTQQIYGVRIFWLTEDDNSEGFEIYVDSSFTEFYYCQIDFDGVEYAIYITDGSGNTIYSDTVSSMPTELDFITIFGKPMYLSTAPNDYGMCIDEQCIGTQCNCEEECVEWDEETGECLNSQCPPECEECVEWVCNEREIVYITDVKIIAT